MWLVFSMDQSCDVNVNGQNDDSGIFITEAIKGAVWLLKISVNVTEQMSPNLNEP